MAESFKALEIDEIQALNKEVINTFGGFYTAEDGNFLNRGSLECVIEQTLFPIFGEEMYPLLQEKIAAIVQVIITRHVFRDGNKRTALAVLIALAELNNFTFQPSKSDEDFLVRIAAENLEVKEIEKWLNTRLRFRPCF